MRHSALCAFLTVICASFATAGPLVIEMPPPWHFPAESAREDGLSVHVRALGEPVQDVRLRVRELRDPRGWLRTPMSAGLPASAPVTVTAAGVDFALKPEPRSFRLPGDYQIRLLADGTFGVSRTAVTTTAVVVIRHPAPEVNVEELKNTSVQLVRPVPFFWPAYGHLRLPLRETTGQSDVSDISLVGGGLYRNDTQEQGYGTVEPRFEDRKPEQNLPAGRTRVVDVYFQGVSWAGTYRTSLHVAADTLTGGRTIPLKVDVTDWVLWPLLTIVLGVVGGWAVTFYTTDWKPRQSVVVAVLKVQGEAGRLLKVSTDGDRRRKLDDVVRELQLLELTARRGKVDEVTAPLERIKQELTTLNTALGEQRKQLEAARVELGDQIEIYLKQRRQAGPARPMTDAESKLDRDTSATVDRIGALLRADSVDEAAALHETLKRAFQSARAGVLKGDIDDLRDELSTITAQDALDQRQELENQLRDAETLLEKLQVKDAEAAIAKVAEAIEKLATAHEVASRFTANPVLLAANAVKIAGEKASGRTRLVLDRGGPNPLVDEVVELAVVYPGNAPENDRYVWNFADAPRLETDRPTMRKHFVTPGDHTVLVEILDAATRQKRYDLTLTVRVGERPAQHEIERLLEREFHAQIVLSLLTAFLASLTGLMALYVGKTFGSIGDYIGALLWGFGVDSSVRGFTAVSAKLVKKD